MIHTTHALIAAAALGQLSIDWYTIDSGGGRSTGGTFELMGTIGQPDASGPLTGGTFELTGGFWAGITSGAETCVADVTTTNTNPGDAGYGQSDGTVDGADLSYFVENWLNGDLGVADVTTTNTNPGDTGYGSGDGTVDGADLSYFVEQWLSSCA